MGQIAVSVIIPMYQSEKTIANTLNSINAQSFRDFEVVVINDGSSDRSEEIALSYREAFPLTYSKSDNRGRSHARNIGISLAQGDYLMFLDSDDILYPHALQELVRASDGGSIDVVCGAFTKSRSEKGEAIQQLAVQEKLVDSDSAIRLNLSFWDNMQLAPFESYKNGVVFRSACGKLIRRSLLLKNGIKFNERLRLCEDGLFMFELYQIVDTINSISHYIYHYIIHNESTTNKLHLIDKDVESLNALTVFVNDCIYSRSRYEKLLCQCYARELLTLLRKRHDAYGSGLVRLVGDNRVRTIIQKSLPCKYSRSFVGNMYSALILYLVKKGKGDWSVALSSVLARI